jgi:hypothetical protein
MRTLLQIHVAAGGWLWGVLPTGGIPGEGERIVAVWRS